MLCIVSVLTVALAGGASAFTPPGFEPSSTNDLTVAYGSKLATNGIQMLRADTAYAPILVGGDTSQFLHWMQADLTSSNTTTTIGGQKIYELINVKNTSAFATYLQPNPPDIAPTTHRYTQLLFNTTGMNMSLASLQTAGKTRGNFNATNVVKSAKLTVLMGNSFDVSFGDKAINNTGASTGSST
ncbi:phosphatidylethanolamine-binding protein [Botrytis cinerea]